MHCSSLCSEKKNNAHPCIETSGPLANSNIHAALKDKGIKSSFLCWDCQARCAVCHWGLLTTYDEGERKSSATHSCEHTHTHTLASKHRSKHTKMYYTKMTMICPTGHCSRCSNRQIGSFPKSPLECLWSFLIHKRRISVCICTEQEKTRPSPYENQS